MLLENGDCKRFAYKKHSASLSGITCFLYPFLQSGSGRFLRIRGVQPPAGKKAAGWLEVAGRGWGSRGGPGWGYPDPSPVCRKNSFPALFGPKFFFHFWPETIKKHHFLAKKGPFSQNFRRFAPGLGEAGPNFILADPGGAGGLAGGCWLDGPPSQGWASHNLKQRPNLDLQEY